MRAQVKGFDQKFVFQGVHMLNSKSMLEGQYWKPGETRKSRGEICWLAADQATGQVCPLLHPTLG